MREAELIADRYKLESRIAVGGMGEVWNAVDTRIGRAVAVKLLHRDMSGNPVFRHRFATEARLVAALNTPRIATLHDYGEFETSVGLRSYLVMELVKGRSLSAVLKETRTLSDSETMRIVAEVAEGLHAAHTAGIVHRDIKPANILITTDGDVKLVDFGIARAAGEADVTETNTVVGTLAYTSPEHLNKTEPSPATDIYSLGIVGYQCLAGQTPFQSDKPQAVMLGHLNDPPPALPSRVPETIADTVMTALHKEPGDRWSSAAVFAEKCRENVDAETTETRPITATEAAGANGTAVTPQAPPIAYDDQRHREATIPPEATESPLTPQPVPPRGSTGAESLPQQAPGRRSRRTVMVRIAAVTVTALLVGALSTWWALSPDNGKVAADDAGQVEPSVTKSPDKTTEPAERSSSASADTTSENPGSPTTAGDGDGESAGEEDGCGENCGTVPNVRNKPCDEAVNLLKDKGFSNTKKTHGSDDSGDVQFGAVYSQSPKAGSIVPESSTITLYFKGGYYCSNP